MSYKNGGRRRRWRFWKTRVRNNNKKRKTKMVLIRREGGNIPSEVKEGDIY